MRRNLTDAKSIYGAMKTIHAGLAILVMFVLAQPARAIDLVAYADILDRHTSEVDDTAMTHVDYDALRGSSGWEQLVESLGRSRPDKLATRGEQLAFWINAYNILTIDLVRRNYPVESIRDIGSFFFPVWEREAGTIGGRSYTLNEIEHEILRPLGDPRIHAAIVCASTSCPQLRREPYEANRIDDQLDDAVRAFLSSPEKGFRLEEETSTVRLSRIFDWFADDFDSEGGVLTFVRRYAPGSAMEWLVRNSDEVEVEYLDYDWRLNDLG